MKGLQIRRGRLDTADAVSTCHAFDCELRNNYFGHADDRQIDLMINRLVMIEGNLVALTAGILFGRRLFRFASAVGRAASPSATKHKILFAGDASSPDESRQEDKRKDRTCKRSTCQPAQRIPRSLLFWGAGLKKWRPIPTFTSPIFRCPARLRNTRKNGQEGTER